MNPKTILRSSTPNTPSLNVPTRPGSVIRKKSSRFNFEAEGCMLGTRGQPKVWDRMNRNIDKFRRKRNAARSAKRVNFASPAEDLAEEYSMGLEAILVVELYASMPAMSDSIMPTADTGSDTETNWAAQALLSSPSIPFAVASHFRTPQKNLVVIVCCRVGRTVRR